MPKTLWIVESRKSPKHAWVPNELANYFNVTKAEAADDLKEIERLSDDGAEFRVQGYARIGD